MGAVRKIENEYIIEYYARGLKYQQKAGNNRVKAKKLLAIIEEKIAQGELRAIVRDVDADIFLYDFLEFARENYPPKSFKRYGVMVGHFAEFIKQHLPQPCYLSHITPRVIEEYKTSLLKFNSRTESFSPALVNLTLRLLRDVLEYGIKLGLINDNPTLHIRLCPVTPRKKYYFLKEEEIHQLLTGAAPDFAFIIQVILHTGLRVTELVNVKWIDIGWQENTLIVRSKVKKEERKIPLDLELRERLNAKGEKKKEESFVFMEEDGSPLRAARLKEQLEELVKRNGIKKSVSFQTFRRHFAGELLKRNIALPKLLKLLGEQDIARVMSETGYLCENI